VKCHGAPEIQLMIRLDGVPFWAATACSAAGFGAGALEVAKGESALLHTVCRAVGTLSQRAISELCAGRDAGFGANPVHLSTLAPPANRRENTALLDIACTQRLESLRFIRSWATTNAKAERACHCAEDSVGADNAKSQVSWRGARGGQHRADWYRRG
jgi:hypothetical protein